LLSLFTVDGEHEAFAPLVGRFSTSREARGKKKKEGERWGRRESESIEEEKNDAGERRARENKASAFFLFNLNLTHT